MSTDTGKVVVNRAMSLDGFMSGPGHTMDWAVHACVAVAGPDPGLRFARGAEVSLGPGSVSQRAGRCTTTWQEP